jgi:hypothetical protein
VRAAVEVVLRDHEAAQQQAAIDGGDPAALPAASPDDATEN